MLTLNEPDACIADLESLRNAAEGSSLFKSYIQASCTLLLDCANQRKEQDPEYSGSALVLKAVHIGYNLWELTHIGAARKQEP